MTDKLLKVDVRVERSQIGRWVVVLAITDPSGRVDEQQSRGFTFQGDALEHAKRIKRTMDDVKRRRSKGA